MKEKTRTSRQLERHFKGVANHWRIEIVQLLGKEEGLSLDDISSHLQCDIKNISAHTSKLVHAGLLNKKYDGREVRHSLSPYGKAFFRFFTTF